jgi:hypothetical protein
MWKVDFIREDLYGFMAEMDLHDAWTATAALKENEDELYILTDIFPSYLADKEEYESLLKEVRQLAESLLEAKKKKLCYIHFHCKGISGFVDESPLPTFLHISGLSLIDTEFFEEISL